MPKHCFDITLYLPWIVSLFKKSHTLSQSWEVPLMCILVPHDLTLAEYWRQGVGSSAAYAFVGVAGALCAARLAHKADESPFVLRCLIVHAIKITRMHVVSVIQEVLAGCQADRTAPTRECGVKRGLR
jgi:hypothetical protein